MIVSATAAIPAMQLGTAWVVRPIKSGYLLYTAKERTMKRIRLIVEVATAVLLFSVIAVAAAQAEPQLLGEKGRPAVTFKGSSGVGTIETASGKKIECKADSPSGTFEPESPTNLTITRGPFNINFENCSLTGTTCTGSGAGSGVIIVLGTFQLRWLGKEITEHKVAFMALLKEASFTCGVINFRLRGCVAGNIEPVNSGLKSTFSVLFRQEKGKQEITEVFSVGGKETEACRMELKEGTGAFEAAGLATTEALGSFVNHEGETIKVEVMG
jgi:hypothetical protein